MILATGLSPAWQQILLFDPLQIGEVNRARETHFCASGKVLNVGLALHHLGGRHRTLSLVGDGAGEFIRREFAGLQLDARWVETAAPTRVCTTLLDAGCGTTTELVENAAPITEAELAEFRAAYIEEAAQADFVVLSGSLPAGAPASFYADLLARTPGRAILDARGPELVEALARQPFLVKPNREELGRTVGRQLPSDRDLLSAMRELNDRGAEWVVVTQGRADTWLCSRYEVFRLSPPAVEVVNPIASGDCVAAGIAWALEDGAAPVEAVRFGLAAAADNLSQLLPARLSLERVRALAERVEVLRVEG